MTLVNLTPHPINLYGNGDHPERVIPPSGNVARLVTSIDCGWSEFDGIPYGLIEYGHVHDLPPREDGVNYIVSLVVALAVHGRGDLLAPYDEVRNDTGTVIGCRFLQRVC